MKVELQAFKSVIARRLFFAFLLVIFIPLLFTGLNAYFQMRGLISKEHSSILQRTSTEYGLGVFGRLKDAQDYLRIALADRIQAIDIPETQALIQQRFTDILIQNDDDIIYPSSTPEFNQLLTVLPPNSGRLILFPKASQGFNVILIERMEKNGQHYTAMGLVKESFLWPDTELGAYEELCITTNDGKIIHCTSSTSQQEIDRLLSSNQSTAYWVKNNKEPMLSAQWPLFMDFQFKTEDWYIITSKPRGVVLGSLGGFTYSFLTGTVLAILLIILTTITVLRRHLTPVEQLLEGTHALSANDFTYRVNIQTNDEYEQLGNSFNNMVEQLDSNSQINHALAKLDQQILTQRSLSEFIDCLLNGLPHVLTVEQATILVFEKYFNSEPNYFDRSYHLDTYNIAKLDLSSTKQMIRQLCDNRPICYTAEEFSELFPALEFNTDWVYTLYPVQRNGILMGALVTGCDNHNAHPRLYEYLNHASVVFNAIQRDRMLAYQANHDKLTGLHNRSYFQFYVKQQLENLAKSSGTSAFLFIDLDHFKDVNDTLGHHVGDKLLLEVAQRLQSCLPENATAARFGGDEFTLFMPYKDEGELKLTARKLLSRLSDTYRLDQYNAHISASIGISRYPEDATEFETLLQCSDIAMYHAKAKGRDLFTFFDEKLNQAVKRRANMERFLRTAVQKGYFSVVFQPKVNLKHRCLSGFEALSRFAHPDEGFVSPQELFELAEETGQILELGRYVMDRSIAQVKDWQNQGLWSGEMRMAINVSPIQLLDENFIQSFVGLLTYHQVPATAIEVELTEGTFVENKERAVEVLNHLRQMGVSVAIDDFGTGYSSLAYITSLPVDNVKIDRSFILQMDEDSRYEGVIANIIQMAHHLSLKITAEGIETHAHLHKLLRFECDDIQGYLYSKPLNTDQARELLHAPNVDKLFSR